MIEFAVRPFGDGMARGASRGGGGEAGRNVIGNAATNALRLVPICGVARHAIAGGQRVIVVYVALHTRCCRVCADQRKARGVVIERRGIPAQGRVAVGAIG